jgi:hypothetical protein
VGGWGSIADSPIFSPCCQRTLETQQPPESATAPTTNEPTANDGNRFIVSYFLGDDTLSVYEPPQRNSGLPGGNFAERGRVRRPGGGALDCYRPGDVRVGGGGFPRQHFHFWLAWHGPISKQARCQARSPPLSRPPPPPIQLGAVLTVNGRAFMLEDADEATLKIMGGDPGAFPHADPQQVTGKMC